MKYSLCFFIIVCSILARTSVSCLTLNLKKKVYVILISQSHPNVS